MRVLELDAGTVNFGGVPSFIYNVYLHIDREKVQFDLCSPGSTPYAIHRTEIEQMGGAIYELPTGNNIITRKRYMVGGPIPTVYCHAG